METSSFSVDKESLQIHSEIYFVLSPSFSSERRNSMVYRKNGISNGYEEEWNDEKGGTSKVLEKVST